MRLVLAYRPPALGCGTLCFCPRFMRQDMNTWPGPYGIKRSVPAERWPRRSRCRPQPCWYLVWQSIEYCLPSADWSHIDTRYRGYTVPSGSPESRKNIQKCDWVGFFRSPPRLLLLCIFTTRRFELNINYFVVLKTSSRNEKS